jgi:hypothetical protein
VYLSDDRLDLLQYRIPHGTVLQPGAFWAVDQGMPDGLPFGLDTQGETLYVTVATDEAAPQPLHVVDAVRYGSMAPDVTFGRFPDGVHDFDMLAEPTEGASNASEDIGFDAMYVKSSQSFDRIDAATLLLDDPSRGVGNETRTTHPAINLSNQGQQGVFREGEQTFASPFNTDSSNYAIRFAGYVYVASAGKRYFGVNSDDGFSLRINGELVGEYANARGPGTTDVTGNGTAGNMTYNFPAAGTYYLVLDFYENGGGEEIEFFQTNATGGNRRLINVDFEMVVFRDAVIRIPATHVVVADENTMTFLVDLEGVEPGLWNLVITQACGEFVFNVAVEIVGP